VARMIVFGLEVMREIPFDTVFVHGIVRDSQGRKMSKSLGNGIDPLEIIEQYGADSLRFSLLSGVSSGSDMRFYQEKVEAASNFCNKVYNAARFALMNAGDTPPGAIDPAKLTVPDRWILHRLNQIIAEVSANLDGYELGLATQKIYDFIWSEFCDWYIELVKPRLYEGQDKDTAIGVLLHVLSCCMKLLHPFMPFITEEIFTQISTEETVMQSAWPLRDERFDFPADAAMMDSIMELIRAIRNLRAEMKVPAGQKLKLHLIVKTADEATFIGMRTNIARLAGAEQLTIGTEGVASEKGDMRIVTARAEAIIPLASLIDIAAEIARINKEIARLEAEIQRQEGKLMNRGFVDKAPQQVVEEERRKLSINQEMLKKLTKRLEDLV